MRHPAYLGPLLGISLALTGCVGLDEFLANTMSYGTNPNLPMGDSLNMRRVQGQTAEAAPIAPQQGNVWPRGVEPMPTLQDIEGERGGQPRPPANPRTGQLGSGAPAALATSDAPSTMSSTQAPAALLPAPGLAAPVIPTASGPGVTATGTERYQTVSTPTGTAVVVPNGNGTSTLMRADGSMEVVTVPR